MFKLRILLLLPVFLIACNLSGGEPVATAVPQNNESNDAEMSSDSPRELPDASPTESGLPPTWTPEVMEQSVDVPNFDSNVGVGASGGVVEQGTAVPTYNGPSINYVVKRGDTLAEICNKYGVSISEVAEINQIKDWDHIEVGQVLVLPADE